MGKYIDRFIHAHTPAAVFLLTAIYSVVLYTFPDSFKLAVVFAFAFALLLYRITKDFFTSLFIIFVLSSFFLFPSKNYVFIYAYPYEYTYNLLPRGVLATVFITVADIFGFFLCLYYIRERIKNAEFTKILNRPLLILIFVAWFIYYAFSLFSIVNYSSFLAYSLSILAQSVRMVIVFIGLLYLFTQKKQCIRLLYITMLSIIFFQSVVGIKQFIYTMSPSGTTEQTLSTDIEERTGPPRARGVMEHPNVHAFGLALLGVMSIPFVLKYKKYGWILLLSFLNIVFAQSRTVWASLFLCFILFCAVYPKKVVQFFSSVFSNTRFVVIVLFITSIMALIILPRLSMISIFFTEEGGGRLRLKMIQEGWLLLRQAPWTGFGMGTNVRVFIDRIKNSYAITFPFPVHFAPMQIALESGIPAALCFFLPFYLILRNWFRVNDKSRINKSVRMSVISGAILIGGYSLSQPLFWAEPMLLGIFLGLAFVMRHRSKNLL